MTWFVAIAHSSATTMWPNFAAILLFLAVVSVSHCYSLKSWSRSITGPKARHTNKHPGRWARTSEQYGLSAHFSARSSAGEGSTPISTSVGTMLDGEVSASAIVQATPNSQELLAKYGAAYLLTSISFSIVSYTLCYLLVANGIDVGALLEKVGIRSTTAASNAGTVAIAYACHKAASPIRFPPTVAMTPVVARLFDRRPQSIKVFTSVNT
jgi:hypothetical protein